MKRITLVILGTFFTTITFGQVKDISLTLSPAAEYTWWDSKAELKDGLLVGGKLGFGFGEYLELRAIYMQSLDLKTKPISGLLINPNAQDVTLKRWGGEFKANIGTKNLMPYLTIGSGVQTLENDVTNDKEKQIYASAGLGVKVNFDKRIVFTLEGKNTTYNKPVNTNTTGNLVSTTTENQRLYNWSVLGSLQFYLGGRKPGSLTELDQAYLNKFKGGIKGLQLVLEPGGNYIAFDNNSLFRDTYMLGGYAGIDFNEFVGIRAFYFQASKDEKISTDFDDLNMYGLEFKANLNDGNGVTPFLTLGGGYINPYATYQGKNGYFVSGTEFAQGGLGLRIPVGNNIFINSSVKAMVTSGKDATDINATDDLQTHIVYNAGIQFTLGKKAKDPKKIYQETLNKELESQKALAEQKINKIKQEYQTKIEALKKELEKAYNEKDVTKAVEILEEKKQTEEALKEVEKVEKVHQDTKLEALKSIENDAPALNEVKSDYEKEKEEYIKMTPQEFESLLERIMEKLLEDDENYTPKKEVVIEKSKTKNASVKNESDNKQIEELNKKIAALEQMLLTVNNAKTETKKDKKKEDADKDKVSKSILKKIEALNKSIEENKKLVEEKNKELEKLKIEEEKESKPKGPKEERKLQFQNSALILGPNFGRETTLNLGLRRFYNIKKTSLKFMPEVYIGFGNTTSFGFSGNVIYPFKVKTEKITPYVGLGAGFGNIKDNAHLNYNIILGSNLDFINKNLFVDYTIRNAFKYNQIAFGYKFNF